MIYRVQVVLFQLINVVPTAIEIIILTTLGLYIDIYALMIFILIYIPLFSVVTCTVTILLGFLQLCLIEQCYTIEKFVLTYMPLLFGGDCCAVEPQLLDFSEGVDKITDGNHSMSNHSFTVLI